MTLLSSISSLIFNTEHDMQKDISTKKIISTLQITKHHEVNKCSSSLVV